MQLTKRTFLKKSTAKLLLVGVLSFGAMSYSPNVLAQTPPPQGPPTPPPPPGELFNKINPFKKKKDKGKDVAPKKDTVAEVKPAGPQTPPPPPNPLNLFKKKKTPAPPPAPSKSEK